MRKSHLTRINCVSPVVHWLHSTVQTKCMQRKWGTEDGMWVCLFRLHCFQLRLLTGDRELPQLNQINATDFHCTGKTFNIPLHRTSVVIVCSFHCKCVRTERPAWSSSVMTLFSWPRITLLRWIFSENLEIHSNKLTSEWSLFRVLNWTEEETEYSLHLIHKIRISTILDSKPTWRNESKRKSHESWKMRFEQTCTWCASRNIALIL